MNKYDVIYIVMSEVVVKIYFVLYFWLEWRVSKTIEMYKIILFKKVVI